jgi:ParB family transcriptional regulator, chromosome partitioning protein
MEMASCRLLWEEGKAMPSKVREIDLTKISPNLRYICDNESIEELCLSIRCHGQLDPIQVFFTGDDFRIVNGEKRWRACRKLRLTKIKVIIVEAEGEG